MGTDRKVKGKKYRILTSAANQLWDVISFWTSSKDVEMEDGTTLEDTMSDVKTAATDAYNKVNELENNTGFVIDEEFLRNLAAYDPNIIYKKGDIVRSNGAAYVCQINMTNPEPWDEAHWSLLPSPVPFKFGIDNRGKYGYYKVGADSVTPFSSAGIWIPSLTMDWNIARESSSTTGSNTKMVFKVEGGSTISIESIEAGADVNNTGTGASLNTQVFNGSYNARLIVYSVNSVGQEDQKGQFQLTTKSTYSDIKIKLNEDAETVKFEIISRPPNSDEAHGYTNYDRRQITMTNLRITS